MLDAALSELAEVGIDRLGMSPVARRAGLTTGALYSRYENATEMAVAVWQQRVAKPHFQLLDKVVRAVTEGSGDEDLAATAACLARPSPADSAAIALLVASRRIDELDEVIGPDVGSWLAGWGARAGDEPVRRAWALFSIGLAWGALLHSTAGDPEDSWATVLRRGHSSVRPPTGAGEVSEPADLPPPDPDTGDAGRDALIEAAVSVIGRAGFERATVSRIARRAGFTSGGLFGRYKTKEHLLADAMAVTQEAVHNADRAAIAEGVEGRPRADVAHAVFLAGLQARRQRWRLFRLEAYVAARHYPVVQRLLHERHRAVDGSYLRLLGASGEEERRQAVAISRLVQAVPLGLSLLAHFVPDLSEVDFRPAFSPL